MADEHRCPECGRSTDAAGAYCSHCGASIETATASDSLAPRDFDASFGPDSGSSDEQSTDHGSLNDDAVEDVLSDLSDSDDDADDEWMIDPGSSLDASLTIVVGAGFGFLTGGIAALVGVLVADSGWGALAGLLVLFGCTGLLISRHTVYETVRLGCYIAAVLLVCVPLPLLTDGPPLMNVLQFALAEIPFGFAAVVTAGFGYWVEKRAPPLYAAIDRQRENGSSHETGDG